ncbi:MAG TPA: type II toxin-antitoxin system VapC family toxin [Candidatus Hydrogenedentes bacterium]|jgi:predicted nucleic acid-binding protein|nr:type II toxin-antitoxin system VapC family toxin [Candidatus Hydrogenedentota bacterium]
MRKERWLIVDPSALLAAFLNEEERGRMEQKSSGCLLAAPGCICWETGNALYGALKRGRITLEQAQLVFTEVETMAIRILDVDINAALGIAAEHTIPAYDAYYLQCAVRFGYPLLTLDRRMLDVARNMNLAVA